MNRKRTHRLEPGGLPFIALSPVVFAQSPSPDWAKGKFSADSVSLRLLLNLFTAEAQDAEGGIFCLSGDDDKQKDSSKREQAEALKLGS